MGGLGDEPTPGGGVPLIWVGTGRVALGHSPRPRRLSRSLRNRPGLARWAGASDAVRMESSMHGERRAQRATVMGVLGGLTAMAALLASPFGLAQGLVGCTPQAGMSVGGQESIQAEPESAPTRPTSRWLWNRHVEVWSGDLLTAFGAVDLAFDRTELERGYRLHFGISVPLRDLSDGNLRLAELEHDQAAMFDGLEVEILPVAESGPESRTPGWSVSLDARTYAGCVQNRDRAALTARELGRFAELDTHLLRIFSRRLESAETAGRFAASWMQSTRFAGAGDPWPRSGEFVWVGDPLLERDVFGAAGAWLEPTPTEVEAPAGGVILLQGSAHLSDAGRERYREALKAEGRERAGDLEFRWSAEDQDPALSLRPVTCETVVTEGGDQLRIVDRFTPLSTEFELLGLPALERAVPGSETEAEKSESGRP